MPYAGVFVHVYGGVCVFAVCACAGVWVGVYADVCGCMCMCVHVCGYVCENADVCHTRVCLKNEYITSRIDISMRDVIYS